MPLKLRQHQHRIGVWKGSGAGESKRFEALTNFSLQFINFVESPATLKGYQGYMATATLHKRKDDYEAR